MLVAKWQKVVGLRSLEVWHLEVLSVDSRWVAMAMNGILSSLSGASGRFGHMVHTKWQRRKLSDEGELQQKTWSETVKNINSNKNWSVLHLERFCGRSARLRPHSRNLCCHWSASHCINDTSVRAVDDNADDGWSELLCGVKDDQGPETETSPIDNWK